MKQVCITMIKKKSLAAKDHQTIIFLKVPKKRLELSRACAHYTLNVARLPIPPLGLKHPSKNSAQDKIRTCTP